MIREAIDKAVRGIDLTREEARTAMENMMNGEATDAQIGGFLVAMRLKGETIEEISSFTSVMREKAVKVHAESPVVLDTCGTGGDSAGTFNISTTAAFVAAGAGITVAKHGNRSVSSSCGSADVLKELGINVDISPEEVSRCLNEIGIAFIFAPKFHSSMKYAIGPRRELGIRTFFNILGPMTNPAGAKRQLMGVYSRNLVEIAAGVLADLGSERAFVVHGDDGLDEITTTGPTTIAEVREHSVRIDTVSPADFGIKTASSKELCASGISDNTRIFLEVLSGKKSPARDIVILNAAFAICAGGAADTPGDGLLLAERSVDSGAALKKFEAMKGFASS